MDIRDVIFAPISEEEMTGSIYTEANGILSGIDDAVKSAEELGLTVTMRCAEGDHVSAGQAVMTLKGTPKQMTMAEDHLIGPMAKTSGIATSAAAFVAAAEGKFRVVCGSWKKVHPQVKEAYRRAVATGGCGIRMLDKPMVYLDKNYVAMLGGIRETLDTVNSMPELEGKARVIQVKKRGDLGLDCWTAAEYGADVLFLDTGNLEDFSELQRSMEFMARVPQIAFAGNVTMADMARLRDLPVDIVGVGKAIIDAPMLDMRFDVVAPDRPHKCDCHSSEFQAQNEKDNNNE